MDGWLPSDLAQRGVCFYTVQMYTLFQKLSEIFLVNATLLFSRLMMWKLFQTTPTEMMPCSFLKPFTPMSVKYWKPFMVSAENLLMNYQYCGSYGVFTSRLLCFPQDPVVWIYVLARDTVLCSRARHFTLIVPLSTQVYKWVPASLILGVTLRWTRGGGGRNTSSHFMIQKRG